MCNQFVTPALPFPFYSGRMQKFGAFIARRRAELGLSQDDVADKAGITKASVSRIESGNQKDLSLSTFLGLSIALKLSLDDLAAAFDPQQARRVPKGSVNLDTDQGIQLAKDIHTILKERGLLP